MNEHPDAQDKLHVRGLLAETGVEESPELMEALLALRGQARAEAPEPTGKLAALLDGTPVPLASKSKRGRGIILSAALLGAMAAGATGVAANPDFLVRADPAPAISFTPEDAPTPERATPEPEPEPAVPEAAGTAAAPVEVAVPAAQPVAPVPAPAAPAPAAAVPETVVLPAPANPAPGGAGLPGFPGAGHSDAWPGNGAASRPSNGYIPGLNHRADGLVRDTMGPGRSVVNGGPGGSLQFPGGPGWDAPYWHAEPGRR